MKTYDVTPHKNRLVKNRLDETVVMMSHKICFYGEMWTVVSITSYLKLCHSIWKVSVCITAVSEQTAHLHVETTVVSYWRKYVHEVLVNRLGGLSLLRKSVVRLTDRPGMTLDVYRGRKTTIQQQHVETNYSRTSMARTMMARLPRLFRTRYWVPWNKSHSWDLG